MKTKTIIILALLINALVVKAQYSVKILDSLSDGTIKFATVKSQTKTLTIEDSKYFLKEVLKVDKGTNFSLIDVLIDDIGMIHEKYQQTHHGIKVAFGEYIVHKDCEGFIISINGHYSKLPQDIKRMPILSFRNAFEKGIKKKGLKNVTIHQLQKGKNGERVMVQAADSSELVFVVGNDKQWHLTYRTTITPDNILDDCALYISCETGDIVFTQSLVFNSNISGTAATRYSGVRTVTTDDSNGVFTLQEVMRGGGNTAIQTFNFSQNPAYYVNETQTGMSSAVNFTNNTNNWTAVQFHNVNKDDGALDAHWGAEKTMDYFRVVHGRNSYDNNNGVIKNYVHVKTRDSYGNIINMDNAFWSQSFNAMFYGDGNTQFDILTALDVMAHEIGHGLCQYTANLVYQGESGAINESLSDIWGACVEDWSTTDKQTWLIGEDIAINGTPLRNMSNPSNGMNSQPNTYGGNYWVNPGSQYDYGGVHINSGVMNYWFYLLSVGGNGVNDKGDVYNILGIGIDKAAKIIYRAENFYMTANTNFGDARTYTIQAATDLYGGCNTEAESVTNAWNAVGVGSPFTRSKNIANTIYTSNTTINHDCNIILNSVKVQNNAKLTIEANETIIQSDFEVALGSELEVK